MIVVDSNTWADFFNGVPSAHAERLEAVLREEEDVATLPIIVTEVLQGLAMRGAKRSPRTSGFPVRCSLASPRPRLADSGQRSARIE